MSSNLRCVIVGVGAHVFHKHRQVLGRMPFDVVGVCDVNTARGYKLSHELDCPFYSDHRTMFRSVRADLAILLTPHPLHAPIAARVSPRDTTCWSRSLRPWS